MAEPIAVIIYVAFCILAGLCGIHRRMGFFGTFFISLIITPVVMLLVLVLTGPTYRVEQDRGPQSN